MSYTLINTVFLLISPFGYILPRAFSYCLIILSWLVLYPIFTSAFHIDPLNAFLPIFIFNCLLFGFTRYKKMAGDKVKEWVSALKEKEALYKKYSEEFETLAKTENAIKEKELALVNLYEITKSMSGYLKFDEIFEAFSSFLKENFVFRSCELVILKWEDSVPSMERVYRVWREGSGTGQKDTLNYDKFIKLVLKGDHPVYLSRHEHIQAFMDLEIEAGEVETLIAIPLLSGKSAIAILSIENLPRSDFERFVILRMQFASQIKKVFLYETVQTLAITDSLTGLYIRRYFLERLDEELQRSKRYKFSFSFLMVDIDNFKISNDTYGHLVGDVVLRELGRIMKENTREIDLIARYGGEEFALLLPETGMEGARLVAERIRKKVEDSVIRAYDEKVSITISIGIAIYPEDSLTAEDIIEKSDKALYAAKKSGRNVVCGYKK